MNTKLLKARTEGQAQIFLSYASSDQEKVLEIYGRLREEGFDPWMDTESLIAGESWRSGVKAAINQSDFFLIFLSSGSLGLEGVLRRELNYALDVWKETPESDIFLIPVRLDACKLPKSLQEFKAVDLFSAQGWSRLVRSLEIGLKRRRARSPEQVLATETVLGIARVSERLQGAIEVPTELTSEWRAAVRRFERVSVSVSQYLALHSEYRKGEALNKALEELESLQHALAAATGWFAPRLLRIAREWSRLLVIEQTVFEARARSIPDIPNPFIFGNPVAETEYNVFTGRRDIVQKIEESILGSIQAPTLLLHGSRRMGKTSILNQLPRLLGADFVSVIVDCQNPAMVESAEGALSYVAREIFNGLRRYGVSAEPAAIVAGAPFSSFDNWLAGLEGAALKSRKILLCLDEYERLKKGLERGWGLDLIDSFRHMIQHRPGFLLMFTGARTFAELGPEWTDRFISARRIRVSFLTKEEVMPLLTRPVPGFDLAYDEDAIGYLFEVTNGQPFLTQAVAFELVQYLNGQHRKRAVRADVEIAIGKALISGGEYFANLWSDIGPEGRSILVSLVGGASPVGVLDCEYEFIQLCSHDILNRDGGFAVPMVRRWLEQNSSTRKNT